MHERDDNLQTKYAQNRMGLRPVDGKFCAGPKPMCEEPGEKLGIQRVQLSDDAVFALEGYDFPGNLRGLSNLLERAVSGYSLFLNKKTKRRKS